MKNTKKDIEEKIKKIKPFFEQLTFFFIGLIWFIVVDSLVVLNTIFRYTVLVLFTGWAFSLLLQEAYIYNVFRPIILNKKWEKLVKK
jgi:hypothetical protein